MHNHDNNKENSWMMWAMMMCCIAPILLILLFSAGGASVWIIFSAVAVFAVMHIWMMFKGHGKHGDINKEEKSDDKKLI